MFIFFYLFIYIPIHHRSTFPLIHIFLQFVSDSIRVTIYFPFEKVTWIDEIVVPTLQLAKVAVNVHNSFFVRLRLVLFASKRDRKYVLHTHYMYAVIFYVHFMKLVIEFFILINILFSKMLY